MTVVDSSVVTADWLALREGADGDARALELLDPLLAHLAARSSGGGVTVVRDLGSGTGSLGRWLAARLPGPQRWIAHDRDPDLLAVAAGRPVGPAADGARVTVEPSPGDLTRLRAADLAGASLVTASALLDLLTADEVAGLADAVTGAACPALLTLSVVGRVRLTPADPFDGELAAAFDDHQRRTVDGRRLLGPGAADAAVEAFERRGATVLARPSPWLLGPERAELTAVWLRGWVGAAVEQRPGLADRAEPYLRRRLAACSAGDLRVVVGHRDLLALPGART